MQGIDLSQISAISLSPGTREDGRLWNEFRRLIVSHNAVGTAPGSSSVRLGNTLVIAGASTQLATPPRESPDSGRINIQVDITPLACPDRHRSQSSELAAALSHCLQVQFSDPRVLDARSLAVQEGQHCWDVNVNLCVLNDDGGLYDACMAAASSALKSLRIADMQPDPEMGKLIHREVNGVKQFVTLELKAVPLGVTLGVVRDYLLCDPSHREEDAVTSFVQITITGEGACSGIEFYSKSDKSQSLVKEAVKLAHERYTAVKEL